MNNYHNITSIRYISAACYVSNTACDPYSGVYLTGNILCKRSVYVSYAAASAIYCDSIIIIGIIILTDKSQSFSCSQLRKDALYLFA